MSATSEILARTAQRYLSRRYHDLIRKRQSLAAGYAYGAILDVGCGQEFNPFLSGDVDGIDVVQPSEVPENYRRFIKGDARKLTDTVERSYNTVIALEVMEHIPDYITFMRSCHAILNRGGSFVLSVPNPLFWTTLLANVVFPTGKSGGAEMNGKILNEPYYGHINFFFPRLLHRVADEIGFDQVTMHYIAKVVGTPLTAVKLLYVYRRR